MSTELVGRDVALRSMLVATASAAPVHVSRPRTTIALIIASVAGGAITGGAVSAAALSLPPPATTVNVEQMAQGLTHDDTQLFGTPFILAGEGDTNVILGSPAVEATDVLIAFNCIDAGTYTLRLDDDDAMTVQCDDVSTANSGGGTFLPIESTGDSAHKLSIETEGHNRYALWASWAAPAPSAEPSASQREALSDGTVTEAEYREGFARYRQCMADGGYPLIGPDDTGTVIIYATTSEAVQSGVEARCYSAEFADLDAGWQSANE